MRIIVSRRAIAAAITGLALAACGGGSSGSSTSNNNTGNNTGNGSVTSVSGNAAFTPNDTLFGDQWHLKNTGQAGQNGMAATAGEDLNLQKVWTSFKGAGTRIAVVDDGLDLTHEDLAANVVSGSYDYTTGAAPTGNLVTGNNAHGTMCAGLAAAVGNNGTGVAGVAMGASLVGMNLLQNDTTANEADAMTRDYASNMVYSNSWGAADGTGTLQPAAGAWETAVTDGITNGRSGKGSIYTWAGGNGGTSFVDRSDYDGQANFAGVIAVAAITDHGIYSSYSEQGSNILVSAYGGEFCSSHTLVTTDLTGAPGDNGGSSAISGSSATDYADANYTKCMNGTSGATPQVSGVAALLLEANPALTFRDVKIILATTARKNDSTDADWTTNGAGLHINHKYGYGAVDAEAAVNAALGWTSVGGMSTLVTATGANPITTPLAIADGTGTTSAAYGAATTSTIGLVSSGITKIEFVDVTVTSDHTAVGDLRIRLTSPSGTESVLSLAHGCANASTGNPAACGSALSGGFRFGVARLMNEPADGVWTLTVDDGLGVDTGSLQSWTLKVYGR